MTHNSNVHYLHRCVDLPDLHEQLAQDARRTKLLRQIRREELNHDLRVIGWGLAAGTLAVVMFRLAQVLP